MQAVDFAVEHPLVKKAERTDGLVEGTGRQLAFAGQMQQIGADLLVRELIR